jgi:solute carrier family 26 (sodium-independent sulfate anion transporter), member 11
MSTVTGEVVAHVHQNGWPHMQAHVIASALSIIVGAFITFLGLARLGWLVDFIPLVSIAAYMTGSALFIAIGQVPTVLGLSSLFDTRQKSYYVVIRTLQYLPQTDINAAMGLTALFMLYGIRSLFNYLARKQPQRRKIWFFCNTLRSVFVILLYTFISAMVNLNIDRSAEDATDMSPFKILGTVPRGFQHAKVPKINTEIISRFSSFIPVSIIVVLIEHISIAKSFGRINNYTINPSQEMIAIGVTNLLAPFLGGYPATGSFSRTAVKSKAGVRTPFAGVITAIVVLLAIYALPVVFFYIPSAALSAIIIHAVGDLITPPNTVYQFWKTSPMEVPIFFAGVFVTIFSSIENGIYTTVSCALALYLYRVFKAQGRFLGKVKVHSVIGDHLIEDAHGRNPNRQDPDADTFARNIFLPIDAGDGSNPTIKPEHPYPGIFIYRFSDGFNYPNANHYTDYMLEVIFKETQRTNPASYPRLGDRPWNDPGPKRGQVVQADGRPHLKAIILDMSSVNNLDLTSVQTLIDIRNQLDRYTAPEKVQWHFANISNRWAKRSLASAGFGYATPDDDQFSRWKPLFSVAEMGGHNSAAAEAERKYNRRISAATKGAEDVEAGHERTVTQREVDSINNSSNRTSDEFDAKLRNGKIAVVHGVNRPFFHIDLMSALQSAVQNTENLKVVQNKEVVGEKGEKTV